MHDRKRCNINKLSHAKTLAGVQRAKLASDIDAADRSMPHPGNAKAPVEIDPLLPGPSSILFLHRMGLLRGSSCCFQEQGALLRVRQITQIAREPSPSG